MFQCAIEDMERARSMVSRLNTILVFHNSIAMETIIVRMNMYFYYCYHVSLRRLRSIISNFESVLVSLFHDAAIYTIGGSTVRKAHINQYAHTFTRRKALQSNHIV